MCVFENNMRQLCRVCTRTLPDSSCIHLSSSTCVLYRRQNCHQFVARLLLDTKGYKSTVTKTNSNYVAEIQSTCIQNEQLVSGDKYLRRHICNRIHVARPGYMFPGDMCPGVNAAALGSIQYLSLSAAEKGRSSVWNVSDHSVFAEICVNNEHR